MSRILGLVSSATLGDNGFRGQNHRREIFYNYPTGGAPLMGLLSLMDADDTDQPEFSWHEKRHKPILASLQANGGVAPFRTSGGDVSAGSPLSFAAGTSYRAYVSTTEGFLVGHTIKVRNLPVNGGGVIDVSGIVTEIVSANKLEFECLEASASVLNTAVGTVALGTGAIGGELFVTGFAAAEGTGSTNASWTPPIILSNYTQIFKKAFSFTGTSIKNPASFDKTGIYKDKARETSLEHAIEMELETFFGVKRVTTEIDDGEEVPRRHMGGILHFMKAWEAADSAYRGGTGAAAITANSDDDKRIINAGLTGSITYTQWKTYMERLFRVTNNKAQEKLCLCGNGHLMAINDLIENKVVINKNMPSESTYGMNVLTIETPFGTVHYKTHPLFSQRPGLMNSAFYLDVQNLRYRPMTDRDTGIRPLVETKDRIKHEWLTEMGLEVRYPESHMFMDNVRTITDA